MKPMIRSDWMTLKGYGEVMDLSAIRGADGALYSAWRPSFKERMAVLLGKPVLVGVLAQRQPPITVVVGLDRVPTPHMEISPGEDAA